MRHIHDENMIRKSLPIPIATLCGFILPTIVTAQEKTPQLHKHPNIILFMVDDMGWQDCSVPFWKEQTAFNKIYKTPNMERLAAQGTKFTNAYASPVSSPTRVSLMTGMNPAAHRVTNWTLHKDKSTDRTSQTLTFPNWNVNGLQPLGSHISSSVEATTLPEILRAHGYYTIHCGKAHFGSIGTPGEDPSNLGFDVNIAGHAAGGLASYLGEENFGHKSDGTPTSPFAVPGLKQYWGQDIFVTEALTLEAKKALDQSLQIDKPFFLYMSHYAIHVPLDKDRRYYQKYIDAGLDDNQARYAALVEGMDKSLGDLMDYLKEKGIADNTIIIFMSDNGGLSAVGRSGRPGSHNYPLNSGKGSAYEGGVRVPMIVSAPKLSDSGETCHTPVEICDFFPTIINMAGIKRYTTTQQLNGLNITPLLRNNPGSQFNRSLYWHFPNKWDAEGAGIGSFSSIIRGDWKLIYYYETQKTELFNITEDIFEIINQGKNPSMAKLREKLSDELSDFLKSTNAQLPFNKIVNKWCTYPNGKEYKPKESEFISAESLLVVE